MLYGNESIEGLMYIAMSRAYIKHRFLEYNGFHKEKSCNWCIYMNEEKPYKE